jgi:hypothetical protein
VLVRAAATAAAAEELVGTAVARAEGGAAEATEAAVAEVTWVEVIDEHRMRAEQRRLDTGPQVRSSQARRHANVKPSQAKPSQAKPRPVRAVRPSPPVAGTAAAHPSGANDGSTLEKAAGCGSSAPATYAPSSSWLGSEWMFHECDGRRCRPGSCACPAPRAPPQARARTRRCKLCAHCGSGGGALCGGGGRCGRVDMCT